MIEPEKSIGGKPLARVKRESSKVVNIKILQCNVGRVYAAQDMAYAVAKQRDADVLILSEPNKTRVKGDNWLKDNRVNVGVLFLTKDLGVAGHKSKNGHIIVNLGNWEIICCYISPNIPLQE